MRHDYSDEEEALALESLVARYERKLENREEIDYPAETFLDIVEYYIRNQTYSKADFCLELARNRYPDDEEIKVWWAYRMRDEGFWEDAIAVVNGLSDQTSRDVQFFYVEAALAMMRPDDAEEIFKSLMPAYFDGTNAELYHTMAELLIDYFYYDRAERLLKSLPMDEAEKYAPMPAFKMHHYELLAEACEKQQYYEEAEGYLQKKVDLDPLDDATWVELAEVQFHAEKISEALDSVEYALSINTESLKAIRLKLQILCSTHKPEYATEINSLAERYIKEDANDAAIFAAVGDYLLLLSYVDDSLDFFRRAIRLLPAGAREKEEYVGKVCVALAMKGDFMAALETLIASQLAGNELYIPYREIANYAATAANTPEMLRILRRAREKHGNVKSVRLGIASTLNSWAVYEKAIDLWTWLSQHREDFEGYALLQLDDAIKRLHLPVG